MAEIPAILKDHVTLEVECVDRLYLNAYVPSLQWSGGVGALLREAHGLPIASPAALGQMRLLAKESERDGGLCRPSV
jgi:hypothetical protein